jgi:hypothetical protein
MSSGSNPTLSANMSLFVFNNLAGHVDSQRAMRLFFAINSTFNLLKIWPTRATWVLTTPLQPVGPTVGHREGNFVCVEEHSRTDHLQTDSPLP